MQMLRLPQFVNGFQIALLFAMFVYSSVAGQTPKVWGEPHLFRSSQPIRILDNAAADPYPSEIEVQGVLVKPFKILITLRGFTHNYPSDVHVLLVGPAGQKLFLLAEEGGGHSVTGLTLTFSDDGGDLPGESAGPLISGTFRPTRRGGKALPIPAPSAPYQDTFESFRAADPNGTWKLFVFDQFEEDSGMISDGWELEIIGTPYSTADCEPLDNWFPRNMHTNLAWTGAAYGNGSFLATASSNGVAGYIYVSADGISWSNTAVAGPIAKNVIFAGGVFVTTAVVPAGFLRWSTNGVSWWGLSFGTGVLAGVAFEHGTFATINSNGLAHFSTNLFQWRSAPATAAQGISGIAGGNGRFVAVGGRGIALVCTNKTNWQAVVTGANTNLHAVVFANGRFVAVGDGGAVIHSGDGFNWVAAPSSSTGRLSAVTYGLGRFVAIGSDDFGTVILASDTGWTWTKHAIPMNTSWSGIAASSNSFIAVGSNGMIRQSIVIPIIISAPQNVSVCARGSASFAAGVTSSCPVNWEWRRETMPISGATNSNLVLPDVYPWHAGNYSATARTPRGAGIVKANLSVRLCSPLDQWTATTGLSTNALRSIHCGEYGLIAVGAAGAIWRSDDGLRWTNASLSTNIGFTASAFGNGRYVCVASNGVIAISYDGRLWHTGTCGTNRHLQAVAFGGGKFVAVGDNGTVAVSADGAAWSLIPNMTSNRFLLGVGYGLGQFIIVGSNGRILTSTDATNWTSQASGTSASLDAVTYGEGRFVVGGSLGTILQSRDGVTWLAATSGIDTRIDTLIYARGFFIGLAGADGILSSPDGITWTVHPAPHGSALRDITSCGDSLYAMSNTGGFLKTGYFGPPLLTATRQGGRVQLRLNGEVSRIYQLQATLNPNENSWTNILTITNLDPVTLLLDTIPVTGGRRFFRLLAP